MPPVEAGDHLKEIKAAVRRPHKSTALSLDNALGHTLEKAWGGPYLHNTFVYAVLLARHMFCPEASPRAMMLDFQDTFRNLVTHSTEFTKLEWVRLLFNMLREQALACRNINDTKGKVETLVVPKHNRHYVFDQARWFPKIKGTRQRVQARMLALKAALACRVSPLLYLWENELVTFSVFSG